MQQQQQQTRELPAASAAVGIVKAEGAFVAVSPPKAFPPFDRWMTALNDRIRNERLVELRWPGSHDSYTCDIDSAGPWSSIAIAQSLSGIEQLEIGIRFFDARIESKGDGRFITHHTLPSTPFDMILKQMRDFLRGPGREQEVVFLQMSHPEKFTFKAADPEFGRLQKLVTDILDGDGIGVAVLNTMTAPSVATMTIKDLLEGHKKRVIALYDGAEGLGPTPVPFETPYTGRDLDRFDEQFRTRQAMLFCHAPAFFADLFFVWQTQLTPPDFESKSLATILQGLDDYLVPKTNSLKTLAEKSNPQFWGALGQRTGPRMADVHDLGTWMQDSVRDTIYHTVRVGHQNQVVVAVNPSSGLWQSGLLESKPVELAREREWEQSRLLFLSGSQPIPNAPGRLRLAHGTMPAPQNLFFKQTTLEIPSTGRAFLIAAASSAGAKFPTVAREVRADGTLGDSPAMWSAPWYVSAMAAGPTTASDGCLYLAQDGGEFNLCAYTVAVTADGARIGNAVGRYPVKTPTRVTQLQVARAAGGASFLVAYRAAPGGVTVYPLDPNDGSIRSDPAWSSDWYPGLAAVAALTVPATQKAYIYFAGGGDDREALFEWFAHELLPTGALSGEAIVRGRSGGGGIVTMRPVPVDPAGDPRACGLLCFRSSDCTAWVQRLTLDRPRVNIVISDFVTKEYTQAMIWPYVEGDNREKVGVVVASEVRSDGSSNTAPANATTSFANSTTQAVSM